MGALHAGHEALIRAARAENDVVVVSLFVNPAQFDDGSDLAAYPRDEARDAGLAADAGADILFAPPPDEIYPPGFQTWVDVERVSRGLEGDHRPGHFRGVATVCLKLFNIVRPQRAYFGQKDAQQVAVIRRLVRDLDLELEIRVGPDRPGRRRPRALVAQRAPLPGERERRPGAPARPRHPRPRRRARRPRRPRRRLRRDRRLTTHPSSPPRSASAPPV